MIARVSLVLALGLALTALAAAPAAYAADQLQVSSDGVHWSDRLDGPLFDPRTRWVPGDSRIEAFSVRNQAAVGGVMTLSATGGGPLAGSGELRVAARVDGGAWHPLGVDGRAARLATIPDGGHARVQVRVRLAAAAGNVTQLESTPLTFGVTLSESSSQATTDHPAGGHHPPAVLAATGAPVLGRWALLGAAALGAGLILLRRSRRDDEGADRA